MKNYITIILLFLSVLLASCHTAKRASEKAPVEPVAVSQSIFSEAVPASPDTTAEGVYSESTPAGIISEKVMYEQAFEELKAMLQGIQAQDFERAVFISENPYYGNNYRYEDFQENIDFHEYMVRKLMLANNKSDSMDFDVTVNQHGRFNIDAIRFLPEERKELYLKALANWGIFTYVTDTIVVYPYYHLPCTYAAHDPFGIKDWQNSQVLHLLSSEDQKGNCFALTAFFKILSDRLKADARICTAPQHIYIQHRDPKGDCYNVDLATAGHPGDGTIQTLTYTTTEAIKNGIALRSYNERQSIGLCLVNLAKSYEHRFGTKDADFILQCAELVLQYDSKNLSALLLKQQVLYERLRKEILQQKSTGLAVLRTQPETMQAITMLEQHLTLLYELGYRQMPYDMQEVIMTGKLPEAYEDKNEGPFTTIDPKDEHRKSFKTLYGGLFREVFEKKELETYGSTTFNTVTKCITAVDTAAAEGFLIDPVAFAYDFGARMYDARLGRFLSIDMYADKFVYQSPYIFAGNTPIMAIDVNGDSIRIAKAIYRSTMSALKIMASTELGAKLYTYYQSNNHEHINIYAFDKNKNENDMGWAETNSFYRVKINKGEVTVLNRDSKSNQDYINASGFRLRQGDINHFVGRNFTNNKHTDLDEYDLAFILYHEIKAHIEDRTGSIDGDHDKFGNKRYIQGMGLWYFDEWDNTKKMVVNYGTDSWNIFKQILEKKVNDGKGSDQNIKDLKYMNNYEKEQENKKK